MTLKLAVMFCCVVGFCVRTVIVRKVKKANSLCEPCDNKHVAISSIKTIDVISFCSVMILMFIGIFPLLLLFGDDYIWWLMMGCIFVAGFYYAIVLHQQYFYFYVGDDYIEFMLKYDNRPKDIVRILRKEVSGVERQDQGYLLTLRNQATYLIKFKIIEKLVGSELLKRKLELL